MKVVDGKTYRIKTDPKYFKDKYGEGNPLIEIEGEHKKVFGNWWGFMKGNPACMLFGMRAMMLTLPTTGLNEDSVYYGKVHGMGELVHEVELEEVENG